MNFLKENVDYKWIEKDVSFLYDIVKTKVIVLNSGQTLEGIQSPSPNQVVLMAQDDRLIPILILGGHYLSNGRVSNFWYWKEINKDYTLSEEKSGYGGFYKSPQQYKVETKVRPIN